ncbi:MAG: hypothetical protein ACKVJN_05645, partial [Woeseiales bacterium]
MAHRRSSRILALLLGALVAVGAPAQDAEESNAAEPPDFNSLQANWWAYFEGPTNEIQPRVDLFLDRVG